MSPKLKRYLINHLEIELNSLAGFIQLGLEVNRYKYLKTLLEEARSLTTNKRSSLKNRTEEVGCADIL